jgi:hypothetical protein
VVKEEPKQKEVINLRKANLKEVKPRKEKEVKPRKEKEVKNINILHNLSFRSV